jgi:hypothetical protein
MAHKAVHKDSFPPSHYRSYTVFLLYRGLRGRKRVRLCDRGKGHEVETRTRAGRLCQLYVRPYRSTEVQPRTDINVNTIAALPRDTTS